MGRFVGNSSLQPVGSAPDVFTRAEVFSTPGTTSWTVPTGVTKAKVFVIGSGSCYRTTQFCFNSTGCCSGVVTPICNYCMNFVGHLPGAGGGYSEKTLTGLTSGQVMTINVGSPTGLTSSSISIGTTTVTANNATETTITWSCTNNSTARDTSLDNCVSVGFKIPRCGYQSCIVGYFNNGGTATGGDINRTGGKGVFIPYFCADSCLDYSTTLVGGGASTWSGGLTLRGCTCWQCYNTGYDYSFGGTRYNCNCMIANYCAQCRCDCCCGGCWCVNATCICLHTYHNVFGSLCVGPGSGNGYQWWNCCVCQRMRESVTLQISNPSVAYSLPSSPGIQPKYLFAGVSTRNCTGFVGRDPNIQAADANTDTTLEVTPTGVGAESGRSEANGSNAISEAQVGFNTYCHSAISGGTVSAGNLGSCWGTGSLVCCLNFGYDNFSFVFGSNISQWPWAGICNAGIADIAGSPGAGSGSRNQCFQLAFYKDQTLYRPQNAGVIDLSLLKSASGENINSIRYGNGAGITAAGFGGGGNRLNTAGGSGVVVVIY